MVDGDLTIGYESIHDTAGALYDRRVTIGFSLSSTPDGVPQRAYGLSY